MANGLSGTVLEAVNLGQKTIMGKILHIIPLEREDYRAFKIVVIEGNEKRNLRAIFLEEKNFSFPHLNGGEIAKLEGRRILVEDGTIFFLEN
ncbi:MAG: hypothetical protein PHO56_04040 [Patescibacteria group bacterium]|nr:hypothetical protein [Patescibacteria group bacterium]